MINSNIDALGVIFPNSYDTLVPELVTERLMGSIPFASRYRLIDFVLSSMVNCGIDNISVVVRKNYHSLLDHLGSGREWDLTRKNGGLNIVPPFAENVVKIYNGRVEALANILAFLRGQKEKYVVMSDANIAMNFDFGDMIQKHIKSGADVTIAYTEEVLPEGAIASQNYSENLYYTLDIEDGFVKEINVCSKETGIQNFSMNIYVMEREFLIQEITKATVRGHVHFDLDVLIPQMDKLKIAAYKQEGYVARISDMKAYFDENMKLLNNDNLDALFSNPVYTKIRDDNPTRYIQGAKVKNVMAADGCIIEGEVENSVLFRGVKIGKGAKVKNCVLMQDTVIEDNASVEYVISDKKVHVTEGKKLKGTDTFPVFIAKRQTV
ncbi:MAG: glucose-1-phosphate adenylyltransferase subunit GlgD [Eubacteriales bacterium]|nr:glucose-1-phosphate adenylyltransferase subunit GlgD [Eubacteriales bacterium]